MGLYGNLDTMTAPELLGWIGDGRKSGTLEVEREKIVKRIMFREGRVVGCASNDPATLMGQFLLARGKITRAILSEALRRQATSDRNLGQILVDMDAISPVENEEFIDAKVEETIFGLFDWNDAVFRFYTDATPDPHRLEVDLQIEDVLRRGRRRAEERQRTREAITDHGFVLRLTGRPEPAEFAGSQAAKRIFGLIDGKKSVSEILLHSHAPEFLVTKLLTALLHAEVVELVKPTAEPEPCAVTPDDSAAEPEPALELPPDVDPEPEPALELPPDVDPEPEPYLELPPDVDPEPEPHLELPPDVDPEPEPHLELPPEVQADVELDLELELSLQSEPELTLPPEPEPELTLEHDAEPSPQKPRARPEMPSAEDSAQLQEEIKVALQLSASGHPEAALELLNAMAAAHPTDGSLRQLVANAEKDFCEKVLGGDLHTSYVPVRTRESESGNVKLAPEESFLLEFVDGSTDIQSLLWVAPLRDVETLMTLSQLLKSGWIEVRQAA